MISIILTPTNQLEDSISFYSKLKYHKIEDESRTIFTDGSAIIEIDKDRFARAGLKLIKKSWKTEVEQLKKMVTVLESDSGYFFSDPNGVRIYLVEGEEHGFDLPESVDNLTGNFAGLSLESVEIQKSIQIYEVLGFKKGMGSLEQGWITYQNEAGFVISMMKPNACPHLFFNPSMTYFNGKNNLSLIEKIRAAGITITEEITVFNKEGIVDNIIIRDPGGYGFFIFSD